MKEECIAKLFFNFNFPRVENTLRNKWLSITIIYIYKKISKQPFYVNVIRSAIKLSIKVSIWIILNALPKKLILQKGQCKLLSN